MKLAVEEDSHELLNELVKEYLVTQRVDPSRLWTTHTNIHQYAEYPITHYACLLPAREKHLQVMLDAGAPIEQQTLSGFRPLHVAAHHGTVEALRVLLLADADATVPVVEGDIHTNFAGMTPATLAAQAGHVAILQALHQSGGRASQTLLRRDSNAQADGVGWAPVHYAASGSRQSMLRFLAFEVGWGDASTEGVLAAASGQLVEEINVLGDVDSAAFREWRERYLLEQHKRQGNEL
mmetsp:Transcript_62689/g.123951  ORF Transcript_62689/g.123951 Transcript_62689/m.123951 type:complete len:237 (+) Transcript_62689:1-711(+)